MSPTETAKAPTTSAAQPADPTEASAAPAAAPVNGAAAPEDNALLPQLVAAMREVAERERGSSLAMLQASVREATEALTARSATSADELRKHADEEIAGIGDWVKLETQRVAAEGDRKIEARRQQLSQQLTDHEQRSQREVEALNERFAEYERELASFFAQLNEITDPAAFGAAAKRMPRPPTITDAAAAGGTAGEPSPSVPAPAASAETAAVPPEATTAAKAAPASEAAADATSTTDEAATEPTAAEAEAQMVEEHRSRLDALGLAKDESATAVDEAPVTEATVETATNDDASDAQDAAAAAASGAPEAEDSLRARLAELDESIGTDEAAGEDAAKATSSTNGTESATAIVVHGLGSFGAITSFKQALERVDGVHGISLSLGPTGEFVYRATHDAGFDLVGAIEGIESGNATIDRQQDGSLRVNVQRSR